MQCFYRHYLALRKEMEAWLSQSRRMDPPGRHGGGEDEANYALAWFPHFLVTGSSAVVEHFEHLRDHLAGWVQRECLHGYEPEAEAHHGTEPFLLFLPRYLGLFPEDRVATGLLADAAEHIGNWVKGIPAWFDWERNRFYGYHIGTRTVGRDPEHAVELAEHFRFIHISLAAFRVLNDERYLDWALRYGRRRAEMIVAAPTGPVPVMWGPDGQPISEGGYTESQRRMSGASHHVRGDPSVGVEVLLASGAVYALGDLFLLSGEHVFRDAAFRIVETLVDMLRDPYGDSGAVAVSYYRGTFGDDTLDGRIREMVVQIPDEEPGNLVLMVPEVPRMVFSGVGKRADMVHWGVQEDGMDLVAPTRELCTASLTLAYQITGDVSFASRALRQASRKLRVARRVLRGGREHADMGGAVCSVAAGHGRNWGSGTVTGCYGPLLLGTRERLSAVIPVVEFRRSDGAYGLPEQVVSLVIPPGPAEGSVRIHNGGDTDVTVSWRQPEAAWQDVTLPPGGETKAVLEEDT